MMSLNGLAGRSIREAYVEASSFLKEHEVRDAAVCAELMLQHMLGWSRSELLLQWQEQFPVEREKEWYALVQRKADGEPVQYIIGETEFYGLNLHVGPGVLIPRPETELLVERVLQEAERLLGGVNNTKRKDRIGIAGNDESAEEAEGANTTITFADIGTGSGAIPISIASNRPDWRVYASDISTAALAIARDNAVRCDVQDRVAFFEGDLLRPFIEGEIEVDVLVSNPPYIPASDVPSLQPEVRLYEPHLALIGGEDGLGLYRRLTEQLAELPKLPTIVGFEVGIGQAEAVAALLHGCADWDEVSFVRDLGGIDRHVIAVRNPNRN